MSRASFLLNLSVFLATLKDLFAHVFKAFKDVKILEGLDIKNLCF